MEKTPSSEAPDPAVEEFIRELKADMDRCFALKKENGERKEWIDVFLSLHDLFSTAISQIEKGTYSREIKLSMLSFLMGNIASSDCYAYKETKQAGIFTSLSNRILFVQKLLMDS